MRKGIIKRNNKGFFLILDGQFAVIDRNYHSLFREGEEWEFSVLRTIRDRRGKEVLILKPERRLERVLFEGNSVVIKSGNIVLKEMTIQEALENGLISKEEKVSKIPFMVGSKEIKYASRDDYKYEFEDIPLTEEEERAIEADRTNWVSYLEKNKEEIEREREKYKFLRKRMKELRDEIASLESYLRELKKSPEIYRRFNFNAFEVEYLFTLTEDEKPVVYEIHRDTTPQTSLPRRAF